MKPERRQRRLFLKLLGAAAGAFAHIGKARASREVGDEIRFFVAGVRFQEPATALKAGDKVTLRFETFAGQPSCAVVAENGRTIGYAPRAMVAALADLDGAAGHLAAVSPSAVPWKKYEVAAYSPRRQRHGTI